MPPPPQLTSHLRHNPPAPSTSGDSESTALPGAPVEKGVEVGILRELAKTALVESLNDIQGAKSLVLDPALAGPLGLVTEVALLKNQAVDKMFWLEPGPLSVNTRNVVWLCRPKTGFMRVIADQIRAHQRTPPPGGPLHYTILLVPRVTELCRKVLEDQGVAGDVTLSEFKLGLIPMEDDLLSLEMEDVSRDIYMNGDDTPIYHSSLALMTFQRAFGLFPRIIGKGDAAKKLADLLRRHHSSGPSQYTEIEPSSKIDSLIIADRSVDWVTPMCTQLTYEGMLDEFVGIKNGHIEVDPSLLESNPAPPQPSSSSLPSTPLAKKRKHHLASDKDALFSDIRDRNFAVVGSRLSKLAKRLKDEKGNAKNLKSVQEMRSFVGKMGGFQSEQQSLKLHTELAETLMNVTKTEEFNKNLEVQQNLVAGYDVAAQYATIEDLMYQQAPWQTVLRLVILASLTTGGLKPKVLEGFKRDFLQIYGYHHLPLLVNLQSLGLLRAPPPTPQTFSALRKSLRLIVDDINDAAPNDISYVYSGYAPISIRLIQCITQKNVILSGPSEEDVQGRRALPRAHGISGWKGFEDLVEGLPGAVVDVKQETDVARDVPRITEDSTTTTVVFFLGGCTYTEIAALRWMAKQAKGRKFLIATTGIITGNSLIEGFGDKTPVPLTE
ncbi:ATP-binding protein [Cryptococcus wingfieldii CBS 7118]|uniref:ATP-binding protein n=1 Tax=Cryptococcus wingfieldii CBS 7118 TaxID=1295528 RepID=A0A1E3JIN0_9TREE|nr:ATP-binding protein [Cryptococcus wingfieldii CBS 7118]ODO00685.1 ATP-binding protein [Cryptococcus wingfieldii CBS 7118]